VRTQITIFVKQMLLNTFLFKKDEVRTLEGRNLVSYTDHLILSAIM